MTATDELRRMLDERGVEWVDTGDGSTLIPAQTATNVAWDVNTWPSGKDMGDCLWVQNRHPLTPKQAIAATLADADATGERQRDAVEVVRCRDCKYARIMRPLDWRTGKPSTIIEEWYCEWHSNAEGASDIEPDGFCAWGETEEGEI